MRNRLTSTGRLVLALLVIVVAAYVLFKMAVGVFVGVAWIVVAVVVLAAIVWAVRAL